MKLRPQVLLALTASLTALASTSMAHAQTAGGDANEGSPEENAAEDAPATSQVITVVGTAFASLLAGTVLVEQIFAWPGIGSYAYRAASTLDLAAIVGVTIFVALIYIFVNLVTDILYGVIDPRIRRA